MIRSLSTPKRTLKIALVMLCLAPIAYAAGNRVTYMGRSVALNPNFQAPMQCILDSLKAKGYTPRSVGCFGYRPNNASAHPTGHACDVDQTGRNITSLNRKFSRNAQIQIAVGCKAVSGCVWRNADCGHFEQRSAPYSRSGTRVGGGGGGYRYPAFQWRPVRRYRG